MEDKTIIKGCRGEKARVSLGNRINPILRVQILVEIYRITDVFCQNNKLTWENNISLYVILLFKSSFSENLKQLPRLIQNPLFILM